MFATFVLGFYQDPSQRVHVLIYIYLYTLIPVFVSFCLSTFSPYLYVYHIYDTQ